MRTTTRTRERSRLIQRPGRGRTWLFACLVACLFVAGLEASPVAAVEKVWGFKGTIASYASGGGFVSLAEAPIGSVVRGQFRFDDAAVDTDGSPNVGSFPVIALAVAIEGTSLLHISVNTLVTIDTENDVPVGPDFRDALGLTVGPGSTFSDIDLDVISMAFELVEVSSPAPTVLASDALPASPPALGGFTTLQHLNILGYTNAMSNAVDIETSISEFEEPGTVDLPLIPDSSTTNLDGSVTWTFSTAGITLCVSGCWVDPPVSDAFTYNMTNSALFTNIADFPTGFAADFEVSVGGSSLGTFGPGDSVDFSGYPGGGVSTFIVSGITPITELNSAEAFPLELVFDTSGATFEMTSSAPVAAPGLGDLGLALLAGLLTLLGAGAVRKFNRVRSSGRLPDTPWSAP